VGQCILYSGAQQEYFCVTNVTWPKKIEIRPQCKPRVIDQPALSAEWMCATLLCRNVGRIKNEVHKSAQRTTSSYHSRIYCFRTSMSKTLNGVNSQVHLIAQQWTWFPNPPTRIFRCTIVTQRSRAQLSPSKDVKSRVTLCWLSSSNNVTAMSVAMVSAPRYLEMFGRRWRSFDPDSRTSDWISLWQPWRREARALTSSWKHRCNSADTRVPFYQAHSDINLSC